MIKKLFYLEPHYGARAYTKKSKLVKAIANSKHRKNLEDFKYVVSRMEKGLPKKGIDCLTSVPRRDSSTNYSLKLAKALSKTSGIPYQSPKKASGRVLIIDDVIETGKTVDKVARKLNSAKEVSVFTATKGLYFQKKRGK